MIKKYFILIVIIFSTFACPGPDKEVITLSGNDDVLLPQLTARRGEHPGVFDADGRQVLLRGVNFNHLGDYWQVDPSLPTVAELGADDWDDAAAQGMNVIRLVTNWSFWQPERGGFNLEYLAEVRAAVAEANARGMYVVIDMHQDAWSKYVFTPADETCPEGTRHQKGWDGAPEWATFTDDEPTCTPGGREDSPAVLRAWENFYTNREGIRDELAKLWGRIAAEFASDSGVAGFDLLNEPGHGIDNTLVGLADFYRSAIKEIRKAEEQAESPGHVIFFEPTVYGSLPAFNLSDDPNLVFAPHNYFESIFGGEGLLDSSFPLYAALGEQYGNVTLWIGEFGHFGDQQGRDAWMTRFAALEDQYPHAGGTWWQWEQRCGDPHAAQQPPSPEWLKDQQAKCDDPEYTRRYSLNPARCSTRAYPRAVPGILLNIEEGACDGRLVVNGKTETAGTAELWFPGAPDNEPTAGGRHADDYKLTPVTGGWLINATVSGEYRIEISATDTAK